MKNKTLQTLSCILLIFFLGSLFFSCVTKPKLSDYNGMSKDTALYELGKVKSTNTIKLVCNWLLWGGLFMWIPSVVDTFKVISYQSDFDYIERKILNGSD